MPPSQYYIYQPGCLFSTLELLRLCTHQTLSGFCFTRTEREVSRGDGQYHWDGGVMERRVFLMGNGYNQSVSVPLVLRRWQVLHYMQWGRCWSFIICRATARGSEASEQQRYYTDMSVSFFRSLTLSLCFFLCVSSRLFLLPAAQWSACQHCRCLCSLSKSLHSDCQWNFVSVSQLSTQSPTHLSDTAVTLCLLIIAKLRGNPQQQLSFQLFTSNIWCVLGR